MDYFLGETDPKPYMIILDLNLPKVDGKSILCKIKETDKYKNIPIIVLSSSGDQSEIKTCYSLGADFYFVKPHSFEGHEELINLICSFFDTLENSR